MTDKERIEALRVGLRAVTVYGDRHGAGIAREALRADDEAARQGEPSPPGPPTPPTRGMWGEGGAGPGMVYCDLPPDGWRCTRERGHEGPCAAVPSNDVALESIERLQAQVIHLSGRLGEAHRDRDALAQRLESITGGVPAEPSPVSRSRVTRVSNEVCEAAEAMGGPLDRDVIEALAAHPDREAVAALVGLSAAPAEPSPEARETAREWVAGWIGGRRGSGLMRSYFAQPPDVQAAIRDELGGGA